MKNHQDFFFVTLCALCNFVVKILDIATFSRYYFSKKKGEKI